MIYHETEHGVLYCGDCLDIMKTLPDNSVDAVVTDPPYGLGFMGKAWDTFDKSQFGIAGNEGENDLKVKKNFNVLPRYKSDGLQDFVFAWASECLRVLKPGGYLLAFAGTRTQHRIACGIEDAGFEIRDMIAWVYGSGFPKSLDVGKAIDKMQGNERINLGLSPNRRLSHERGNSWKQTSPNSMQYTESRGSSPYEGYGTALKPALEPITVARKPIEGTVAENVLKWGTGAIDIDGCRVDIDFNNDPDLRNSQATNTTIPIVGSDNGKHLGMHDRHNAQGRFPANLIHDGSDEVLELFPDSKSTGGDGYRNSVFCGGKKTGGHGLGDSGSAARFFYCAKASKAERGENNIHPTVKPIALMEYLIKLVAREGYTVLDPFLGSGTTAIACVKQGRRYIGCEMDKDYCEIAAKRIDAELEQTTIFREES